MGAADPESCVLKDGRRATLRSAAEPDAPALLEIERGLAVEGSFGSIREADEFDRDEGDIRKRIKEMRELPNSLYLVAECAGRILGELSLRGGKYRRNGHTTHLGISIIPSARGVGVGRAMMERAIRWAGAAHEVEKITLFVFADNAPAIALYRSLGFVEEGRRINEIRLGPRRFCDDIVFGLFVKRPTG